MAKPVAIAPEGEHFTETIVSFVVDTKAAQIPEDVCESAKIIILDTIGVALAAAPLPIGRILSDYVAEASGPPTASILGRETKVSPPLAALVNGSLANALDFNEGFHVATHTLPAALAIAEQNHLSGRDLLDAFIIGYEAGTRIGEAFDGQRAYERGPTYRGWWHVGLLAPIAAAIAVSRLLKLDHEQTTMAIGIATCNAGGVRRNMGTMSKALHAGNGARNGIEAALLAQRGFTADPEVLEAPLGFMQAVCSPEGCDWAAVGERLGHPYILSGMPSRIKAFPACTRAQCGIDAALAIRAQAAFSADDVEAIEADLHTFSLLRLDPTEEDAAGFSLPYLMSAALVYGTVGLEQITPEAINDPRVRSLMKRVKNVPMAGSEKVTVRLRDKRVLSAEFKTVRRLKTMEEIEQKFHHCATRVLTENAAEELRTLILGLERQPTVDRMMALGGGRMLAPAT